MLVTEQLLPGAHSHSAPSTSDLGSLSPKTFTIEFDMELGELEEDSGRSPRPTTSRSASTSAQRPATSRTAAGNVSTVSTSAKGFALTLGLVLHALSDGLALGSSIVSDPDSQELSLVIFAALAIHKGTMAIRVCHTIDLSNSNGLQHPLRLPLRLLCWRVG